MHPEKHFEDGFKRAINYMRISITDRCNLRCVYCMPAEGVPWLPHQDVLTFEEIERIVTATATAGMKKIRITGGEPLVRRGVVGLIERLSAIPGIDDVAMTTNAILMPQFADALVKAGLKRINVSLDTLRPERFASIARRDGLERVLKGIEAAERAGMAPIKINAVVLRGVNDDEIVDLARLTVDRPWHVRFIEAMPLGGNLSVEEQGFISADEILERLGEQEKLEESSGPNGSGPARYFKIPGARGTVGVISPMSHFFCGSCNRVRLSAEGMLRLCLFSDQEIDLRAPLRGGASKEQIVEIFQKAIRTKPERHHLVVGQSNCSLRALSQIGG
ncbi:MAG TPA: GTP 3',8-cyclase MoaA [Chloroflexota bacterium]|nr:GTP 3',8-cyclase MoaA [Chloroflexota bacterium]